MASFPKEVNPRLAERLLKTNGRLAHRGLTSLVKDVTGCQQPPWWRHQMETFSALLAICAGNSPGTGEFPAQRPVTRSFDVFFDLRLNKRLRGWWFETLLCPLWRHCNDHTESTLTIISCGWPYATYILWYGQSEQKIFEGDRENLLLCRSWRPCYM